MNHENNLKELKKLTKEIKLLTNTSAILGWDQETYMPDQATEERSSQLGLLEKLAHERLTSDKFGELLENLGCSDENPCGVRGLAENDRLLLRRTYKAYRESTKLPEKLVVDIAEHASMSQVNWVNARQQDDFSIFEPYLAKMVELQKEKAECLGYQDHIYDALLDQFEPWAKTKEIKDLFEKLQPDLTSLLEKIKSAEPVDESILFRKWDVEKQKELSDYILSEIKFDSSRGRLDESAHPFTTTLGKNDIRITTRYDEKFFNMGLYSTVHEAGHALYEMGLPAEYDGTMLHDCASLGIHESQSRFWENIAGKSRSFFKGYMSEIKKFFPETANDISAEDLYRAVNRVKPDFIRVEADEVTYNLHVILRFQIELMMTEGSVKVKDLPEVWNSLSKKLLGIVPEKDSLGVLQDVHWSFGGIGYFPTYTLGNLYSAQFYHSMQKDIDVDGLISAKDLNPILQWLRDKIHSKGAMYSGTELCKMITGSPLDQKYFMEYLNKKYSDIYKF